MVDPQSPFQLSSVVYERTSNWTTRCTVDNTSATTVTTKMNFIAIEIKALLMWHTGMRLTVQTSVTCNYSCSFSEPVALKRLDLFLSIINQHRKKLH